MFEWASAKFGIERDRPPVSFARRRERPQLPQGIAQILLRAGADSRANSTIPRHASVTWAVMPPRVMTGLGDSVPDCDNDPLTTGTLVGPKPLV